MHAWQPNRKYRTFIVIDDHSIRQVIVDNTVPLSRGGEIQVESFTRLNNSVTHYRHGSTLHCVSSRWVGETEGQCRSDVVQSTCWEVLYWVQMTVWHIFMYGEVDLMLQAGIEVLHHHQACTHDSLWALRSDVCTVAVASLSVSVLSCTHTVAGPSLSHTLATTNFRSTIYTGGGRTESVRLGKGVSRREQPN